MALGAARRRVVRDVVRDGLTVTLAGLVVGVVAALATVRVVETLLFGVTPQDPITLARAAASLTAIAILACWVSGVKGSARGSSDRIPRRIGILLPPTPARIASNEVHHVGKDGDHAEQPCHPTGRRPPS